MSVEVFDYEFDAWPCEGTHSPATYELFRSLSMRVVLTFTASAFETFRDGLAGDGITLRGVTRTPHHEPETIL